MKTLSSAIALSFSLLSQSAATLANDVKSTTTCVDIAEDSDQSPENIPHNFPSRNRVHTWCYSDRDIDGQRALFIFNIDGQAVREEMSQLLELDSNGKIITTTHASLLKGEITIHSMDGHPLDVLPAPNSLAAARHIGQLSRTQLNENIVNSAEEIFTKFSEVSRQKHQNYRAAVTEGSIKATIRPEALPYAAYWWPHKDLPLAAGPFSPLGKYDLAIKARTGTDPASVKWEREFHSLQHVPWGGHCNGWAASSVLYKEVEKPRWDAASKQVLFTSDFNGMLAEASFCVDWAFYGARNNSDSDDTLDISPDKFHKVLTYYIETLKKPIAFDRYSGKVIDNWVISGYESKITKDTTTPNTYLVTNIVTVHPYPREIRDDIGPAAKESITYKYKLTTDDQGEITGGTWLSKNPDFLWVPLSQSNCGRENPKIDPNRILELMKLPFATKATVPATGFNFSGSVPAKRTQKIILAGAKSGFVSAIRLKATSATPDKFYIDIIGYRKNPSEGSKVNHVRLGAPDIVSARTIPISFEGLLNIEITNDDEKETRDIDFKVESIEYLTGP